MLIRLGPWVTMGQVHLSIYLLPALLHFCICFGSGKLDTNANEGTPSLLKPSAPNLGSQIFSPTAVCAYLGMYAFTPIKERKMVTSATGWSKRPQRSLTDPEEAAH